MIFCGVDGFFERFGELKTVVVISFGELVARFADEDDFFDIRRF